MLGVLTRTGALAVLLLAACSENFGPAPPDGGRAVAVRSEGISGPRTERAGTTIASGGGMVFVGTEAGLYRFGDAGRWAPVHGGFLTTEGISRAGLIRDLVVESEGQLIFFGGVIGPSNALIASSDGGDFFVRLQRPDPLSTNVDAIGIAPAGVAWSGGAWLAVQGGRAFTLPVGEAGWREHLLPSAPLEVGAICADGTGRIGLAVAAPDWTLWSGSATSDVVDETGIVLDDDALALTWVAGELAVATSSGIWVRGARLVDWPGVTIEHAALEDRDDRLRWAFVGRRSGGTLALATGTGSGTVGTTLDLPEDSASGVCLVGDGARVLLDDGATTDGTGVDPYGGTEADLFSLAVRPGTAIGAVGHTRTGEIHQGPVADPNAWATRGTPLRASAPREILFDPAVEDALFVGSFGVYRSDPLTMTWQERNTGFFSYDPGFFAGPFPVSAFDVLPDGSFWVGGTNGDGPYRAAPGSDSWTMVHDGLGEPGSWGTEPGLPLVTQVQAFAEGPDGAVWMGAFRGGVFRLEPTGDVWESRSSGLPRVDGSPLDGCCAEPGVAEVDVRDLVRLGDGSLLAATGWGVYRLREGEARWQPWSTGLFNQDVHRLLRHPSDSQTVLAASRGRPEAPDWLHLSEDGGQTWFPVASALVGRTPVDLAWSDPARLEVVVLLEAQGLWRMELDP